MSTTATITIRDGFGTDLSLYREAHGYPDGPGGVLDGLRVALTMETLTRPGVFDAYAFRFAVLDAWKMAGLKVSAVATPPARPALFHYEVRPSRGADHCVHVLVSALEEPGRGGDAQRMVPVHGFLVFPTRVRRTDRPLTRDQELEAIGRNALPFLADRVAAAAEAGPPMLGQQRDMLTAGQATLSLAAWMEAGERADQGTIAALEERGIRAIQQGGRDLARRLRAY